MLPRSSRFVFLVVLTLVTAFAGCSKPKDESAAASDSTARCKPSDPSHTESALIVKSVSEEITRLGMFAARLEPAAFPPDCVSVTPKERDGGGYHYAVDVQLPKREVFHAMIDIPGSIWDPQAYVPFTRDILARLGLNSQKSAEQIDGKPLVTLTNLRAEIIQQENHRISEWLSTHPLDPNAHEQAALLLGALGLRENCGSFFDTHAFCNRAAAHLALSRALRPDHSISNTGAVAELLIGLLIDTKQDCENRIDALTARSGAAPELKPWTVAARLRNRRDYRILPQSESATLLEKIELFRAMDEAAGSFLACKTLEASLKEPLPDWGRIILEMPFSVDDGHRFTDNALTLEFMEAAKVFPEIIASKPSLENIGKIFNREAEHLVNIGEGGAMKVNIIDDGIWAMFFQRHICHTISFIYYFLHEKWGVEDDAATFKTSMSTLFQRMTLFPLVSVSAADNAWIASEAPAVRKLIETHPEWVPEDFWGQFIHTQPPGGMREFPRPESWYSPGLPPGTAYRFRTRALFSKDLIRATLADAQRYYDLAPWQYNVALKLYTVRSGGKPNAALFEEVLGKFLDYYGAAMEAYADLVKDSPAEYIATMHRWAEQNPGHFLQLGHYLAARHMDKEAAEAYENAIRGEADAVWVSNSCEWIVNYYADHGNMDRAMEIAKFAAEVYSFLGLETMAKLLERLNKPEEAEEYYKKIQER